MFTSESRIYSLLVPVAVTSALAVGSSPPSLTGSLSHRAMDRGGHTIAPALIARADARPAQGARRRDRHDPAAPKQPPAGGHGL